MSGTIRRIAKAAATFILFTIVVPAKQRAVPRLSKARVGLHLAVLAPAGIGRDFGMLDYTFVLIAIQCHKGFEYQLVK
jgi:hypothetical protein